MEITQWKGALLLTSAMPQNAPVAPHPPDKGYKRRNCSGVYVGIRDSLKSEILRDII